MKKLFFIFFSLLSVASFATHERAGEITYQWLGGLTYKFTITTYTKGSSNPADRCFLEINFGDDTVHYVACRSNYEPGDPAQDPWFADCTNDNTCSTHHMGEWGYQCNPAFTLQSINVKKNVYTITHTYPGPNTYIISMTDPNRNACIINVPDDMTAFSIQDTLTINPFLGGNNSVVLNNCPIDKACSGKLFIHNPGASDPDGDSISYKLGRCFENVSQPVAGYFIPGGVSIDPVTGDFTWNVPPPSPSNGCHEECDEYNFAIDIEEWRKSGSTWYKIGTVRRDMQLRVCDCDNDPPIIDPVKDTCIVANTNLSLTVSAHDQGGNLIQSYTATGGPFNTTPAATFTNSGVPDNPVAGFFSWTPSCAQVRMQPYLVTLKAVDDGAPDNVPLTDYESFFITVIAPAPTNLAASPHCASMDLTWNTAPCTNNLLGYKIYRATGCDTLKHGYCETGMPTSSLWSGYSQIGLVSYTATTTFTDNNNGNGLVQGVLYSYRVVAYYQDGSESYVSDPICASLVYDVPIITNVDVQSTGTSGSINVKWLNPIANPLNYDTTDVNNFGPYKIELMRATGYGTPTFTVTTITSTTFAGLGTSWLDTPLNTQASAYTYRPDFYDVSPELCPAQKASSVFISCNPSDNKITLSWNEHVPWTNYRYDVYRFNSVSSAWDSIGNTALQTFTDSGLGNGVTYCYKVKAVGKYPDPSLPAPLINWSQELCCAPVDNTPPCPLTLAVDSSCELSQNVLTWNNPNGVCCDDALYYIIYHSDSLEGDFGVIDTISDINTTTFIHDSLNSIAGCYAVTSVDSFGNESAFSNLVCIDNCPFYELPNVFTPNGDGKNDFYTPLHPYKYVKDIDIKIYNRWGTEVFRTTNPEILWDGKSVQTKMLCSDGVYFYVCVVHEIRLKGIIPHILKGNITLLSK
jgi:gliding motility-associated-like protein